MKSFLSLLFFCFLGCISAQDISRTDVDQELGKIIHAMEVYHCNAYHYTDSSQIAALRQTLVAGLPENPSKLEAYRSVNQLVCAFGDAHTRVWDSENVKAYRENNGLYFPFSVVVNENRLTISADHRGMKESLAGYEIIKLNGISTSKLIDTLMTHASRENDALDQYAISKKFSHYLFMAFGENFMDNNISISVKHNGIAATELSIAGITYAALTADLPAREEASAIDVKMLENNVAYLRIKHFDARPKAFAKAFKQVFQQFADAGAQQLIIDLRGHNGGDARIGAELARYIANSPFRPFAYSEYKATPAFKDAFKNAYLPKVAKFALPVIKGFNPHLKAVYNAKDHANARVEYPLIKPYTNQRAFTGEVMLLMDNNTFSAGTCFAAVFKDYAMGTIIGQESGNLANFHADGLIRIGLEVSNTRLQISNSYLVRPSGDETAEPVQPDVYVETGVDALEVALELIGGAEVSSLKK